MQQQRPITQKESPNSLESTVANILAGLIDIEGVTLPKQKKTTITEIRNRFRAQINRSWEGIRPFRYISMFKCQQIKFETIA